MPTSTTNPTNQCDLPLKNLRSLRNQMRDRGWVISCFPFTYKEIAYFIFIELYPPDSTPQYALVKLCFAEKGNLNRTLERPANSAGIMVDAKTLREYFGIKLNENLGDILKQFTQLVGQALPKTLPEGLPEQTRKAILHRLDTCDKEDPRKVHCMGVRRNPQRKDGSPGRRSAFNTQKTQMLRPGLFAQLGNDPGLSFTYSIYKEHENSDTEIIDGFTKKQGQ